MFRPAKSKKRTGRGFCHFAGDAGVAAIEYILILALITAMALMVMDILYDWVIDKAFQGPELNTYRWAGVISHDVLFSSFFNWVAGPRITAFNWTMFI